MKTMTIDGDRYFVVGLLHKEDIKSVLGGVDIELSEEQIERIAEKMELGIMQSFFDILKLAVDDVLSLQP